MEGVGLCFLGKEGMIFFRIYDAQRILFPGNQKERKISWRSNTLHDNDDFQLQDLSLDGYGIQSNHHAISNNNFKADEGKKKEHIQGENIDRSITKKGKETVRAQLIAILNMILIVQINVVRQISSSN